MSSADFDLDSLAAYLHLGPQQVARMADRGKLPGRKVGGVWRFSHAEIHHWLEDRIGAADEEDLVEVEGVLRSAPGAAEQEDVVLAELMPASAVAVPLEARTRNSAIHAMVALGERTGHLWDAQKMEDAVRAREDMQPTALDNGVALLHPRRPMPNILGQAFVALGVTRSGIPFGGAGGTLTDMFFLIASTDDRGHLRTLARLSRALGLPGVLEALRAAPDAAAAHAAVTDAEQRLAARG